MTKDNGILSNFWFLDENNKPYQKEGSLEEVGRAWSEESELKKRVAEKTLNIGSNRYWVSTVFLGIDHQFAGNETPILWETMITKNGEWLDYQRRYMCHDDAVFGHNKVVELLKSPFTINQIDDEVI
ncbi:MAG: hypothetical protein GY804_03765 [Alphaproteobacteria bacterium]|nr:hypothetical protein [Alphaproteobacteria bacterium]